MDSRFPIRALLAVLLPATLVPAMLSRTPASQAHSGGGDKKAATAGATRQALSARQLIEQYTQRDLATGTDATRPIVRAMIVDLPDPIDSPHLDWAYDGGISAIRRGAETVSYVMDRFWLPWIGDAASEETKAAGAGLRAAHPGVLLFRSIARGPDNKPSTRDTLQLVFVVGETPTAGVNKVAFRAALTQLAELKALGALRDADVRTLRVIGPYFTGSAASLRVAFQSWTRPDWVKRIEVVTGSATQESIRDELSVVPGLGFHATINSDRDLLHVLVGTLSGALKLSPADIAVLKESSTSYGQLQQFGSSVRRGSAATRDDPLAATQAAFDSSTVVLFPIHIQSLRDQQETNAPPNAAAGESRAPVSISLRDPSAGTERPPSVSSLTPASVTMVIDEIARALSARHFRAVGIIATDVRDKLFLAREVRRRLPDVQLFTTEANVLYLLPEFNDALRGMVVASSYPLFLEAQEWSAAGAPGQMLGFTDDSAEGIFNAVLWQLGSAPSLFADYGMPKKRDAARRPPIWLTAVGRRSFVPLSVVEAPARQSMYALALDSVPAKTVASPTDVVQAGERLGASAEGGNDVWHTLRFSLFALTIGMLLLYRLRESRKASPEYHQVDRRSNSHNLRFNDLSALISARSLLMHEKLYTMVRDLALGVALVFSAVLLMQTSDLDDAVTPSGVAHGAPFGFGPTQRIPTLLLVATAFVVIHSAVWIARVIARTFDASYEYNWHRNWATGRRRTDPPPATVEVSDIRNSRSAFERRLMWFVEVGARSAILITTAAFAILLWVLLAQALNPGGTGINSLPSLLFFHRAVQLTSGMSPAAPLLLAAAGFSAWSVWHLLRIQLLKSPVPFDLLADHTPCDGVLGKLQPRVRAIRDRLFFVVPNETGLVVLAAILILCAILATQFNRTIEGVTLPGLWNGGRTAFDLMLPFCVLSALGTIAWGLYRFLCLWSALKGLLDDIAASPFLTAFERVPKRVSHLSQLSLRRSFTRDALQRVAATQWSQLVEIHAGAKATFDAYPSPVRRAVTVVVESDPPTRSDNGPFDVRERAGVEWCDPNVMNQPDSPRARERAALKRLRRLFRALNEAWKAEPLQQDLAATVDSLASAMQGDGVGSTSSFIRRTVTNPGRLWLMAAEEAAAVQVVAYVEWVLQHLRVLAFFLLISVLLTTALLGSYPFQPQSTIKVLFGGLLVATAGSIVFVGTQMNRDDVISRVTRMDPGRITWNATYIVNIFVFGVLPILAYVGSDVQPIRDGLLSWLEPLARAMSAH